MPPGAYRLLPDVALQSSIENPGYIICSDDPALANKQGQTPNCTDGFEGDNNQITTAGGTSFAAPIFAGFVAILNGVEHTTGQGNINPILYNLASNPTSSLVQMHASPVPPTAQFQVSRDTQPRRVTMKRQVWAALILAS
jgi:subtilisin family serine protease